MPTGQSQRVTVKDIVDADERVIKLKKMYQDLMNNKNQLILEISRVEADIIANMGAFTYLNNFNDIDEAQKELLPKFRILITKKRTIIDTIKNTEIGMKDLEKHYDKIAQDIVKELQKQFKQPETASCPESAPDGIRVCTKCDGECKGHQETGPCQQEYNTAEHTED